MKTFHNLKRMLNKPELTILGRIIKNGPFSNYFVDLPSGQTGPKDTRHFYEQGNRSWTRFQHEQTMAEN